MTGSKLWRSTMDAARVVFVLVGLVFGAVVTGTVLARVMMQVFPPHEQVTNLRR